MKRETETGLRLPQAGECLEPAEAGRSTKDGPLQPSEGPLLPDFWSPKLCKDKFLLF